MLCVCATGVWLNTQIFITQGLAAVSIAGAIGILLSSSVAQSVDLETQTNQT